ncbi:MAG: DUF1838 family protein [Sphingomonadaceae bacterium]
MRHWVLAAMCLAWAGSADAQRLSFDNPDDQIAMYRKIQCSTRDLEPVVYHWSGRVWSRVPGEPDRHLWNVEGMNVRQCVTVEDPDRGRGVRMVSRELMFYLDPATGAVIDEWQNPWTGKVNRIFHVANDPVNQRPVFPRGADGSPYRIPLRVEDGRAFWNVEVPLFYTNPLGGDFQEFAGNHYHAMEIFNFFVEEGRLRDRRTRNAKAAVSWVRLSGWMPFMEMGSRPGSLVFNATGQVVDGIAALPRVVQDQIALRYPEYRVPPPADDQRPNATTWTEFRKFIEAEREKKRK